MNLVPIIRPLLVWAAGGPGQPDLADVPVDPLFDALCMHRVERRFLLRARADGVVLPDALTARLEVRLRDVDERVREQLALFTTVRDAVREHDPDAGLVPLKGFNLYGLTGDEEHKAFSVDLDVIGRRPQDVAAVVEQGSGFHFHGEEHPYVFAHMDTVEVHSRYIVTGFPAEGVIEDPTVQAGAVQLTQPFAITALSYDDLAAHLVPGQGPAAGIDVLRPEVAVLIRCAHVYVSFAATPQPAPVATVRLEELVQVREYLALPMFDADVFRDLHKRFAAGLVTDFMRRLHLHYFGSDPFADLLRDGPVVREQFPQNLWWDGIDNGFPVRFAWDPDELLLASDEVSELADKLGAWPVQLEAQGAVSLDVLKNGLPEREGRFVWHGFHGGVDQITCSLRARDTGLEVSFTFAQVGLDQMVAVGVATGHRMYELFYLAREGTYDFTDYTRPKSIPRVAPPTLRCTTNDGTVVIVVELPWTALGLSTAPVAEDSFPLVLRARVQDRPWGGVVGGAIVPLRVKG